ncbi:MAG: S8 family serine peptidase, partial [Candidatus Thorarchaeota archaeon]
MNNLRKTAVMLLIGVFITSALFVPITPFASVNSQVAAPTNYEQDFVEKWAQRILDEPVLEKVDPVITSYIETGILDSSVDTTRDGSTKLLVYLPPSFDDAALDSVANVMWKVDFKLVKVASISVSSIAAMKQLVAMDDIQYIQADYFLEPEPSMNLAEITQPDMFYIRDLVGATGTIASGYDGTGVIAGVVDSGVDFSQEDMRNAEYYNGSYPMSYDPSSMGLTEMVIANYTVVPDNNATAWLEAGHLLTYEMGGKYYLNTTGWDPVCNNEGSHRSLMGLAPPYGDGYPYGNNIGFIGLYEWAWGGNNVSEFVYHEMWKDWEIPAPAPGTNYTFGWAFQQKIDGYAKVFAPSMIYDGDLVIDWNGTLAWTRMWNWAIRSQVSASYAAWEIDLNTTADRNLITGMMDWSFVDDYNDGYIFNKDNNILMANVDADPEIDVSLGSLSWAYDGDGYLAEDPGLFFGITDDGMVWNAMFTTDTDHGHWTAAAIASAGTFGHDVYENGTLYYLKGIAPGAKIIASKGITSAGDLGSQVWCMGFTLNETSGYWEYIGDGPFHRAHMVSNSWGWGPGGMYLQLRIYSMVYDLASIPDVLATGYPGVLMFFSAGNEGIDYGSMGTPGGTYSVVSVGATMSNQLYVDSYGPYQPHHQQALFTATGPAYAGFVKPDVMAPGMFGYSPEPSENDWLEAGDTYLWWSGTSLSCPIAAGVAALIMDAGNNFDPQRTKDILLSTATDMGYDPLVQGHGFVNAEAACAAVAASATGEYIFETESFENYGDQIADSWAYWVADWAPFDDIYYGHDPTLLTPGGLESSSLFYGTVTRGEVKEVTMNIEDFAGTGATLGSFSAAPQPWYYTEADKFTFSLTGYTYNDTLNNATTNGFFNLYNNMTGPQQTGFDLAEYVTIQIAYDASESVGSARLFDWTDDYVDLQTGPELNWWNGTHGDTLIYVQRSDRPNLRTMRVASPLTMGTYFTGSPTLVLFGATGVTVDVTIQVWQKSTTSEINLADFSAGVINATLTVPVNAEYGVHQGSITFADGAWTHEIPYSYTVEFDMTGAEGEVMVLVDGATDPETTPYDTNTAVTCFTPGTTSTQDGGGFTTFHVNIPYVKALNASVLVMRASWQNPGTVVDFALRTETGSTTGMPITDDGGRPFDPNPTEPLKNTIIWDPGHLINGTYWFEYNI